MSPINDNGNPPWLNQPAIDLLPLNNTWTGENTFNSEVTLDGTSGGFLTALGTGLSSQISPDLFFEATSTSEQVVGSQVSGDSTLRFTVDILGGLSWGDGTAVVDTNLYRDAANTLRTDDTMQAQIFQSSDYRATLGVANTAPAFRVGGASDNTSRWRVLKNGTLDWADGTAAPDTNLYRGSSNQLKTDSNFRSEGSILSFSYDALGGNISASGGGSIIFDNGSVVGSTLLRAGLAADTFGGRRFSVNYGGIVSWGDGSSMDTNLYRSAADTLKTDDTLDTPRINVQDETIGGGIRFFNGASLETLIYQDGAAGLEIQGADVLINANLKVGSIGSEIGFYGTTPIVKQATPVTLGDVITVLQNLGLTA